MKIRLMGTREECALYVQSLDPALVVEVSEFYPNRGSSRQGRVYLEVVSIPVSTSLVKR